MFKDRFDAAHKLAAKLIQYKDNQDVVILAVPRGGLELGSVLSQELNVPLDVIFTKKIGYPGNPEYAIGAVSLEGIIVDKRFLNFSEDMNEYIQREAVRIRELLEKRYRAYRGDKPPLDLKDKIVIVTDDGVATGSTLSATLDLIRKSSARKLIVAIPVAPREAVKSLREKADEVICLLVPKAFFGVGQFYENFEQVKDEEAIRLLREQRS